MRCSTGGGRSARPARPRPPEPPRAARPGAAARGGVCGGGSLRGRCRPFHPWEASPLYYGVFRWKLPLFYRLFAGASITLLSLGGCLRQHTFCQRRRSSRDDSKLRPCPTENSACRSGRKSRNHPVSCASLGTFCAHRKYPPEAGHAASPTIFAPEHPAHSAPHLYRLPFFSVRIDGEGRWVYHTN